MIDQEYFKKYYQLHKEERKAYGRERYANLSPEQKAKLRKNTDRLKAADYSRKYYWQNREKQLARQKIYRAENKEAAKAYQREYRKIGRKAA